MKLTRYQILLWTPRMLAMLFTAFISIFAADVFSEEKGFLDTLIALFMHLIPSMMLAIFIAMGWKKPIYAGLLFIATATIYLVFSIDHPTWVAGISGPLFFIGVMYVVCSYYLHRHKKHHTGHGPH